MAQPWNLGPPIADFSGLANLGQQFDAGFNQSRKLALENERRQTLANLGQQGLNDPQALGIALLKTGDLGGALTAAQLAQTQSDRQFQRQTNQRDFDFRQQEATRAQTNADRTFGLQKDIATRREQPPSGWRFSADGTKWEPIPGGPQDPTTIKTEAEARKTADSGKPLPAELGARVALGQQFLDDYPELRKQVAAGGVTGLWDRSQAAAGRGPQGEALRRIKLGSEAIIRNLTGAGMNKEEAEERVRQYEPAWTDDAETVTKKLDMLNEALQRIEAEAYRGRGIPENRKGKNPFFDATPPAAAAAPAQAGAAPVAAPAATGAAAPSAGQQAGRYVDTFADIPEGKRFKVGDRVFRKVNGRPVPE